MTKKCTTANNLYDNVEFCPGEVSLPGMRPYFFTIAATILSNDQPLPIDTAESGKEYPHRGDFTLAAGAKWKKADLIPNESGPSLSGLASLAVAGTTLAPTARAAGTGKKVGGLVNLTFQQR